MLGMYFMKAIDATVGNMFREKGSPTAQYPDVPFLRQSEEEEKAQEREREENEALWAKAWMSSLVQAGQHWGENTETKR